MAGFENVKVGDTGVRTFGGTLPMKRPVSKVTVEVIPCVDWDFDRAIGAGIDDLLGRGPPPLMTGNFLDPFQTEPSDSHGLSKACLQRAPWPLKPSG